MYGAVHCGLLTQLQHSRILACQCGGVNGTSKHIEQFDTKCSTSTCLWGYELNKLNVLTHSKEVYYFVLGRSTWLYLKKCFGTLLVAQWLRICLPMQATRVRALLWEDPTCCGATKPVRHNYWACALEPTSHNYWSPRA